MSAASAGGGPTLTLKGTGAGGGALAAAGGGPTVTVKVTGADGLPLASAAVQVTVVAPSAKNEPEAGSHVTAGAASKLSVAGTSKSTRARGRWRLLSPPAPAGTSMSSTGAT